MLLFALDCTSDYANQHIMLTKQLCSSSFFCSSTNQESEISRIYQGTPHWTSSRRKIESRDFSFLTQQLMANCQQFMYEC